MPSTCEPTTDQHPLTAALAAVSTALAAVVDVPVFTLDDRALPAQLERALAARAGVDELIARLVGEASARDLPRSLGHPTEAGWLAQVARQPRVAAARTVAHAKAADQRFESTRRAWSAGAINADQATAITTALAKVAHTVGETELAAAERTLVAEAPRLTYDELRHLANHTVEVLDPVTADALLEQQLADQERRALAEATLRFRRRGDGTTGVSGRLPDLHASMLKKALDAYAAPRRRTTRPDEAGVLDLDGAHSDDDPGPRPYPTRLGQALVELIEHLPADRLPQAGGANATVVVTLELEQLTSSLGTATLDTGEAVTAGEARRLACNAGLVPIVLGGPSRILDLGMAQRLFDRHQRLALAVRDGGCVFPGCDRPPAWCEGHHLVPWSRGGPTDLAGGCLVCPFHHRLLHADWEARLAADGVVEVIPPARIDPERTPLRNARHHRRRPPT